MLPWKQAAKNYRWQAKKMDELCDKQYEIIKKLIKVYKRELDKEKAYSTQLEQLIETGTERD